MSDVRSFGEVTLEVTGPTNAVLHEPVGPLGEVVEWPGWTVLRMGLDEAVENLSDLLPDGFAVRIKPERSDHAQGGEED